MDVDIDIVREVDRMGVLLGYRDGEGKHLFHHIRQLLRETG